MAQTRYFILNKKEDYVTHENCYTSHLLDSGEKQTKWSRLYIRFKQDSNIRVRMFVSEHREQILDFRYEVHGINGHEDCLLRNVTGRYVCLMVEGVPENQNPNHFLEIEIFFQSESWMSYLPEVYTAELPEDSFLFRYFSIFQWLYYDMGERIRETPHMLYPRFASLEYLDWLAGWFDLDNRTIWNREQLMYLLENGNRLLSIRGTRGYMEEMVKLFTGYIPFIVEYYQLEPYQSNIRKRKRLEQLYGDNAYVLTVVLPQEAAAEKQKSAMLRQLIRSCIPADMEYRLIILEPYIFLDHYTYIGINSQLGGYRNVALDGNGLTPYISVIGSR